MGASGAGLLRPAARPGAVRPRLFPVSSGVRMILILLLGLGLAAGLLSRGNLRNLATLRVRHAWLPLLGFGLQAIFVLFVRESGSIPTWSRLLVLVVTSGSLFGFLVVNAHLSGSRLLLAGAALNAAVMLANGGFMPVTPQALARAGHTDYVFTQGEEQFVRRSKDIVLEKEDTRLWLLSDVFGIPAPLPFSSNFSPGDLLIGLGAAWLVYRGLTCAVSEGEGGPQQSSDTVARQPKAHGRWGKELGHGVRSDAEDDRPGADRPAVPRRPATQSARGHP